MIDVIHDYHMLTDLETIQLVDWIGISRGKFYDWRKRYGQENRHNGRMPRDYWLQPWERDAIIDFYQEHQDVGYRALTYLMMDRDIVAVSPATVYRVLSQAGCFEGKTPHSSKKGAGFEQPLQPHDHWHVDVSYVNIAGTFYYACCILDGYSRSIVHWDIRESMKESDIQCIIEAGTERYPQVTPRIISDNGPQFMAKEFKAYLRLKGMDHVRTSPYYPQSNGKIERFHQSLKRECIRPQTPLDLDDARRLIDDYIHHYNTERLHAAIGYITPQDQLAGKAPVIHAERDRKLAEARQRRKSYYQQNRPAA